MDRRGGSLKMIFRRTLVGLVALITLIAGGCGFLSGMDDARELAETLLNDRFVTGGVGSEAYYSDLFWKYTRQEDWHYIKDMVETRLGALQSYTLRNWTVQKNVKMGDLSGTFIVFIYDTEYEYGNGQERITLMKGFWDRNFQIVGHNFESDIFA
jgi:hypothetical protein